LIFPLAVTAQEEEPPSMAMLEFLGEWDEADTGWIDQALDGAMVLAGDAEVNEESKDDE
jgi:hypothetical protein